MRILFLLLLLLLPSCLARPILQKPNDANHRRQNIIIGNAILENAQTGDWLVTRGYHATDNLVANATGIPISHVAIFNSDSLQVIEAEGKGVHLTALNQFIDKSYRLLIIRPRWLNEESGRPAWENAQKLVGKNYDFLGTIGFDFPSSYYCSELAVSVYEKWFSAGEKFPTVIKPGELYLYGQVIYDSLPRDEF